MEVVPENGEGGNRWYPLLLGTSRLSHTGGLAVRPGRCRRIVLLRRSRRNQEARNACGVVDVWAARGRQTHGGTHEGDGDRLNIGVQDAMNLGWKLAQVVKRTSPESLLDTYHAERHPVGARVLRNTMAQVALRRTDDRSKALGDTVSELFGMDEPRRRLAAEISGLGIHYDLGEGHPLLGRRMPDLDLVTGDGPLRVFTHLHDARPMLLNLGEPGGFDITPWADRVQLVDAKYRCG